MEGIIFRSKDVASGKAAFGASFSFKKIPSCAGARAGRTHESRTPITSHARAAIILETKCQTRQERILKILTRPCRQKIRNAREALVLIRTSVFIGELERNERDRPVGESHGETVQKAIVGFEFQIVRLEGKQKFNQNRSLEDRIGVIEGLRGLGDERKPQVAELMEEIESRPKTV